MEALLTFPKVSGLTTHPLLTRSGSGSTEAYRPPPLNDDRAYMANLFALVLQKELGTLD